MSTISVISGAGECHELTLEVTVPACFTGLCSPLGRGHHAPQDGNISSWLSDNFFLFWSGTPADGHGGSHVVQSGKVEAGRMTVAQSGRVSPECIAQSSMVIEANIKSAAAAVSHRLFGDATHSRKPHCCCDKTKSRYTNATIVIAR